MIQHVGCQKQLQVALAGKIQCGNHGAITIDS